MKKWIISFIDGVGGVILSCLLAFGAAFLLIVGPFFGLLFEFGKSIRHNWKKGYMNEVREEIILFLIVWGPFYFTFLYIIYNNW